MSRPATAHAGHRFDVRSADGTSLAVWVDGDGPPLVMFHGSIADHTTFAPFVEVLRHEWTTWAMDRRGFGASGDAPGSAIERDFEDVVAVVDAVAARTGGPVTLWGHSYGANCAMGGAALTPNVQHLVIYEPSLGLVYPPGSIDAIEEAVAAGEGAGPRARRARPLRPQDRPGHGRGRHPPVHALELAERPAACSATGDGGVASVVSALPAEQARSPQPEGAPMDDLPVVPLLAGAAVLLVGPLRRRAVSVAGATARAGVGVVGATVVGARDILGAAVRGEPDAGAPTAP